MHYVLTFFGVLLKAVATTVVQFFGETSTSGMVTKASTIIAVLFIIAGVVNAIKEELSEDIGKVLLVHVGIIVVGYILCWLLSWSLIIGLGGAAVLFMFFVLWLTV